MAKSGGGGGGRRGGGSPPPPPTPAQQAANQAVDNFSGVDPLDASEKLQKASIVQNAIQGLQTALQGLQTAFQGLTAVSTVANLVLDGFSNAVQSVAGKVGGLVRLVNPGVLDQFQRAFSAFQSQLGEVFAPLLQGLGQLVQTVANALAGLNPQGRSFLLFLTGAAAGLGAAIVVGGVFLTALGALAGSMIAGATAAQILGLGLDAATAGLAAIGAAVGAGVSLGVGAGSTAAGASAGGLAALGVAGGTIEQFMAAFGPALETMVGAFNAAGSMVMPQLAAAVQEVMPALSALFSEMVQYLPPLSEVLAAFASEVFPELVRLAAIIAREFLPVAAIMAKMAVEAIKVAGALLKVVVALVDLAANLLPILALLRLARPAAGKSPLAVAPAPVTSASYTGIEELFRKSQEAAILGRPTDEANAALQALKNREVQTHWATAIGESVAGSLTGGLTLVMSAFGARSA